MKFDRRRFLGSSVGVAAAAGVTAEWVWPKHIVSYCKLRLAVLNAQPAKRSHTCVLVQPIKKYTRGISVLAECGR